MSTGLTIGGWFASGAIKRLVELVSSQAVKKYGLRTGLQDDIRKLRISLVKIDALLRIAEGKRAEGSGCLDELLRELKDAAYDAEDLLEEFEYEVLRVKMESDNPRLVEGKKLQSLNAADAASKVREIRARLDMVADEVSPILAMLSADVTATPQGIPERETSSFPHISDQFVGRDEEIQKIIEDLLLNSVEEGSGSNNMKNPRVLPIVGLGGVGKTALAQHVYNHDTIQNHFELKMWVCVSENFDVKRLTSDIIEEACKQRPNIESLDALQQTLKEKILHKKFLLVLDDLWSEDRAKWERLCAPLAFGSQESKILVTTRSEKIASIICTMHPVLLEGLVEEDYWVFFRSCAFGSRGHENHLKLVAIGMTIAKQKRLRGSPLAAKTLGSLLSVRFDEKHWESIMDSEIWQLGQDQNDIMPVLELSYKQLPGQLKQCFAYCSLFPKDYEFEELQLVKMWIAQGLIKADASKRPEDVGSHYFQDLVFRSFFQQQQQQQQKYSKPGFVIHDLLHDMAQYVSKEECHRIGDVKSESIPCTIRHLSIYRKEWKLWTLKNMCELKKLRTLVVCDTAILDYNSQALHELFGELTSIRVLVLRDCSLKELPESIGNLKHLRFLDVSYNYKVMLPESLCHLYNLQFLDAINCGIKSLPGDISNFISLRHLSVEDEVISQIGGIGKLTSLQILEEYEVRKEDGHKIIELRDMNQLRGRLRISNLENVENKNEAISGANLRDKLHIDELKLSWSSSRSDDPDPNLPINDEEVLEGLEPPPNIKSLEIDGYGGVGFPSWFSIQHLSNLNGLWLENCRSLECWERLVLVLGQLPYLKSLSFSSIPAIKKIDDELFKGFQSLEELEFDDIEGWEEWSGGGEGEECDVSLFPLLRNLTIRKCPKLRNISTHLLPLSLATLHIESCEELTSMPVERLKHLVSLEELVIGKCPKLGSSVVLAQQLVDDEEDHHGGGGDGGGGDNKNNNIQLLPSSLKYLDFSSCGQLIRWIPRCLLNLTSLTYLRIADCPHITSLPREVRRQLTALEKLYLNDCQELMTLEGLQALPSLRILRILNCPKLVLAAASSQVHPAQGDDDREDAFPSLVELRVNDTSMLTLQPLRGRLRFLLELWIEYSLQSAMFSGAEERAVLQDLTSLPRLNFNGCKNLLSLPPELHTLSSLQSMYIFDCSEIQSLPEKGLPTSLIHLVIENCNPVLKERCQKETGPDWHKISHINCVYI